MIFFAVSASLRRISRKDAETAEVRNEKQIICISFTTFACVTATPKKPQWTASTRRGKSSPGRSQYLASDKLEAAAPASRERRLAAKYIADQFKKVKLKAGVSGTNGRPGYACSPFSFTPVARSAFMNARPTRDVDDPGKTHTHAFNVHPAFLRAKTVCETRGDRQSGAHTTTSGHAGRQPRRKPRRDHHGRPNDNASASRRIIELATTVSAKKREKQANPYLHRLSAPRRGTVQGPRLYVPRQSGLPAIVRPVAMI